MVNNLPFVVHVHDGRALRKMTIQPLDMMYDVRRAVAEILQRHYASVTLGYTAPWFKKDSTKLPRKYIETADDLWELRADIQDYLSAVSDATSWEIASDHTTPYLAPEPIQSRAWDRLS